MANYGHFGNNYMGVGLAFPTERFALAQVDVSNVASAKQWPKGPQPGLVWRLIGGVWGLLSWALRRPSASDPWSYSQMRSNALVFTKLRCKVSGDEFCVGTYHMPCAFWAPQVRGREAGRVCF